ncbi:hypothetical protein [Sporolactobacillus terrae]|uniref:Uncharacterized protein n=1 Tax=Sporolactobacillus terrae TaxID=269673 RepID=A0A5K7X0X5_9BACL|nr:hypothetical protein [Sporolactobacillus terrae]BBN99624.1 hypothetical protein St703_23290 [Sporolactobacillus terrae]
MIVNLHHIIARIFEDRVNYYRIVDSTLIIRAEADRRMERNGLSTVTGVMD